MSKTSHVDSMFNGYANFFSHDLFKIALFPMTGSCELICNTSASEEANEPVDIMDDDETIECMCAGICTLSPVLILCTLATSTVAALLGIAAAFSFPVAWSIAKAQDGYCDSTNHDPLPTTPLMKR